MLHIKNSWLVISQSLTKKKKNLVSCHKTDPTLQSGKRDNIFFFY